MLELFKINFLERKNMYKINQQKLIDKINEKWIDKNCPCCGENNWAVSDQITTLVAVDEKKSMRLGGTFQPVVSVTCNNCGYTRLVNCMAIDVIDTSEDA